MFNGCFVIVKRSTAAEIGILVFVDGKRTLTTYEHVDQFEEANHLEACFVQRLEEIKIKSSELMRILL